MTQEGQEYTKIEAWIQHGSLFNGSRIYLNAVTVNYNFKNTVAYRPFSKISTSIEGAETAVGDATNWNRRKGLNSYDGFEATMFTISGDINILKLGSIAPGILTITPGMIHTILANGNYTYRFYDGKIGSSWAYDPISGVQKPYTEAVGIPVVFLDANVSAGASENILNYSLTLREDKT